MSITLVHIKPKIYVLLFVFQSSMYTTQPPLRQALCGPTLPVYSSQNTLELHKVKSEDVRILLCSVPLPTLAILSSKELKINK